jgi:hypothetical protein
MCSDVTADLAAAVPQDRQLWASEALDEPSGAYHLFLHFRDVCSERFECQLRNG